MKSGTIYRLLGTITLVFLHFSCKEDDLVKETITSIKTTPYTSDISPVVSRNMIVSNYFIDDKDKIIRIYIPEKKKNVQFEAKLVGSPLEANAFDFL